MIRSRTGAVIINKFFFCLNYDIVGNVEGGKKMKLRTQLTADGTIKKLAVIIDR